jgi:hypothetical protein
MGLYQVIRRHQLRILGQLAVELALPGVGLDGAAQRHALQIVLPLTAAGAAGGWEGDIDNHGAVSLLRFDPSMGEAHDTSATAK